MTAAADVAHELRTPLGGIVARVEAAQDGVLETDRALAAIHDEALRLTRLAEDLARLADAQRPGLLLDKQHVDLAQIARRQASRYAGEFAAKEIAVALDLDAADVMGDGARLEQVVDNLLSNALRYTDRGGRVALRVRTGAEEVELEVSDTGIGIRVEDLPHVFERFWRGEKSRSRATGGAGIGLAIVRELVRAHDGRVDLDSTRGAGSSFRVWLPSGAGRPP
ncbi:MAG: sensor histidine kinase [Thermoleophilia bacterium]